MAVTVTISPSAIVLANTGKLSTCDAAAATGYSNNLSTPLSSDCTIPANETSPPCSSVRVLTSCYCATCISSCSLCTTAPSMLTQYMSGTTSLRTAYFNFPNIVVLGARLHLA